MKKMPVLIASGSIIYKDLIKKNKDIKIYINKKEKKIKLDKDKICFYDYNVTIIEIKPDDDLSEVNFMEIDNNILEDNSEIIYENKPLYSISYSSNDTISVSYGLLNKKVESYLIHSCKVDSFGSPILNFENNKVIGLNIRHHYEKYKEMNYIRMFLKYIINKINKINNNQILITLKISEFDVKNKIYFLGNGGDYQDKDEDRKIHPNLGEFNENNINIFINGKKYKFQNYFCPESAGKCSITLEFKKK